MKKLIKAIKKIDLTTAQLAHVIADIIIKYYGEHNYEDFKRVINERLK